MSGTDFNADELARYSRHLIMPEVTREGQRKLKAVRVLCLGAGGLGSPAALYLAAAGVGTIGLLDHDRVDLSNLQRQILHSTSDVGRPKVESGGERLREMNPHIEVVRHDERFTSANAMEIVRDYDVVIDGSDNFPTRYLSNDVCVFLRKPLVYGSVFRFDGQMSVFAPHLGGPCYRCLFPEPPPPGAVPNCAEAGVLGVLPGIVGLLQTSEALKLVLGIGESMMGRLLHFDALKMKFREFKLQRDPECPVCGENPTITAPIDYEQFCGVNSAAMATDDNGVPTISVQELKAKLDAREKFQFVDVREPSEQEIAQIDGATLIPMSDLMDRMDELSPNEKTIVLCRSGSRSAQVVGFLQRSGFTDVWNVGGGLLAWSDEIDPSMPKY